MFPIKAWILISHLDFLLKKTRLIIFLCINWSFLSTKSGELTQRQIYSTSHHVKKIYSLSCDYIEIY